TCLFQSAKVELLTCNAMIKDRKSTGVQLFWGGLPVGNETNILIYQTEERNTKIDVRKIDLNSSINTQKYRRIT
ncbi:hypothetical protein RZN22_14110, partial [Bacillaceae bacterium S4-13-58]